MQPWEQPARPLPIPRRPVHQETIGSYLNRLALANRVSISTLAAYLAPYRRPPTAIQDDTRPWTPATPQRLAVIAGQPLTSLIRALPGMGRLRSPDAPPGQPAGLLRACQHCMAARGIIALVVLHREDHQHLCVRHARWLRAGAEIDLTGLPEVVHAQQRHARLRRRRDPARIRRAFATAYEIVLAWYDHGQHVELYERWRARLRIIDGDAAAQVPGSWEASVQAITYPETVALASLLASPHWRQHASSVPTAFYQEAGRRLGIADPHRVGADDPLVRWVHQARTAAGGKDHLR